MNTHNLTIYNDLLIWLAVISSGLTSARIALFLSERWGRLRDWFAIVLLLGISIPAFIAFGVATVAVSYGGIFYGVIVDLLTLPAVGLVWFAVLATVWFLNVGVIAGIDRIFNGLAKKLDAVG